MGQSSIKESETQNNPDLLAVTEVASVVITIIEHMPMGCRTDALRTEGKNAALLLIEKSGTDDPEVISARAVALNNLPQILRYGPRFSLGFEKGIHRYYEVKRLLNIGETLEGDALTGALVGIKENFEPKQDQSAANG